MSTWQADKRWSDRFLPEIKSILGLYLIGEPPREEDAERNTDLMVLRMEAVRIGCRVRKHGFLVRYPDEFTIRTTRPSGVKTELGKIIEGWGDYFMYGFCDETERDLEAWFLGDLRVFRRWFAREVSKLDKGKYPGMVKTNGDNSSTFRAFSVSQLPAEFVIARK